MSSTIMIIVDDMTNSKFRDKLAIKHSFLLHYQRVTLYSVHFQLLLLLVYLVLKIITREGYKL